jgi:hypothetical protein
VKFPLGLLVGALSTLACLTGATIISHLAANQWPPIPASDILVCTLASEVSQGGMHLIKDPDNQLVVMGYAYHLAALRVGVPDQMVIDCEALIIGGSLQDKCEELILGVSLLNHREEPIILPSGRCCFRCSVEQGVS